MIVYFVLSLVTLTFAEDFYDPRYDNFNIEEIIENLRLMKPFLRCFIGDDHCSAEAKKFRKWIPDALQSNCAKCTPKQRVMVAKVFRAAMKKLPELWNKLLRIHDPEKKRTAELYEFLEKYAPEKKKNPNK